MMLCTFLFNLAISITLVGSIASVPHTPSKDDSVFSLDERATPPVCGKQSGGALCPSSIGTCCSQYGYCGNTEAYCGQGCQSGSCLYSTDNTCGSRNGGKLCSTAQGICCSQYGYCGNTEAYCGQSCQSGSCLYSTDNTCGSRNGGKLCSTEQGICCSQYGYCGSTGAYCGKGCQSGACETERVRFAGINIAGCDFGIDTNGYSGTSNCPSSVGATQMQHFVQKDNFNIFRLPVGWQYLVHYVPGGTLDPRFFATYDNLVTQCLESGAYCIIDIHNYARWNGKIIGQGGPSDQQFISLWTQLAKHYAPQQKIIFGIMNEPHDLDMTSWARTVQAVVKAIRVAGATSQMILLPGNDWSAASSFVQDSAPAMATVADTDGTTAKLVYDIHQYYDGKDGNGGGNEATCTTDHVSNGFSPLADYLRSHKRQALLSETGGGNTGSCSQYICSALDFLNANSDVFLGWVGWAAGSFDESYLANESPQGDTDTSLVRLCLAPKFNP